ncbi:TPA: alpha/beta fold hydrolase, partial [Streptococcus equi subsp. equi]|nr:alpha/beta fold hydrolase [Streptococcus equi subsp. equi]
IDYVNTGELFSEIDQKIVRFKGFEDINDRDLRVGTFYYPKNEEKKHLILLVCGYEESYLDFKSEIFFWLKNGYTVFCYDVRGTGRSQGRKVGGFTQFLKDCLLSIEYIEKNETFKKVSLVGHSMGGFAVATSLQFKTNIIDNSVIISGFDYPSEFVRKSVTNISFIFTWPIEISIKLIEFLKFGNLSFLGSVSSINIFNKPVLIIQSSDDKIVKINNSIYNKKKMITNKNVEYILLDN